MRWHVSHDVTLDAVTSGLFCFHFPYFFFPFFFSFCIYLQYEPNNDGTWHHPPRPYDIPVPQQQTTKTNANNNTRDDGPAIGYIIMVIPRVSFFFCNLYSFLLLVICCFFILLVYDDTTQSMEACDEQSTVTTWTTMTNDDTLPPPSQKPHAWPLSTYRQCAATRETTTTVNLATPKVFLFPPLSIYYWFYIKLISAITATTK